MSDNRTRKIRILQHNCNRSDIAMHSYLQTAETTADIVITQEPWIGTNSDGQNYFSISHPSFLMLMSPTTHCPRTLTYVSNTNPFLKASLQPDICSNENIQVIKISTPNLEPIHLFNIYNGTPRYDRSLPYTIERKLKNTTLPPRTILAGDFNAHHMWWNSRARRFLRHETLIQIFEEGDYDLINEEDTPTYHYSNGSSILDLAFSSPPVTALISNWAIDEDNAELRVRYNHSQRKNHTKFFAKLSSHWLKTSFFRLHPLFYRERSQLPPFSCLPLAIKGRRKLPSTLRFLPLKESSPPHLLVLSPPSPHLLSDHEAKQPPLCATTPQSWTPNSTGINGYWKKERNPLSPANSPLLSSPPFDEFPGGNSERLHQQVCSAKRAHQHTAG